MNFFQMLQNGIIPYWLGNQFSNGFILAGCVLLCMIPAYLLGSLNFAVILSRRLYGEDVRTKGSGNGGMTNMLRSYGKKAAGLTLLGDALKAVVSAFIGYFALGTTGAYLAGMFCILGHMFPLYYHFKGGKGVVTTAVMILVLNPVVFLVLFVIFLIIVLCTRYVSLGSVMCVLIYPLLLYRIQGPGEPVIFAVVTTCLVVFMHRGNIKRLYEGTERKISLGRKKEKKEGKDNGK